MKKLLAMTLALSVCAAPVAAFAEEDVTAESLLAAMQEYSQGVESMSCPTTLNLDAALTMTSEDAPETSFAITMTGGFDIKEILQPMQMAMNGDFSMSALGENIDYTMDTYMITSEDGSTMDTYSNVVIAGEETGWQHVTMDMAEMLSSFGVSSMNELNSMSMEDLLGTDVSIEWAVEEQDDEYHLTAQLNFADMMPMIEEAIAASGEEIADTELQIVEMLLGSFNMNIAYCLDKETKATTCAHIDFNDSDLSILNQFITAAMASSMASEDGAVPEMTIELNDFSMDMEFNYDDVSEIVVPEEALAAEAVDADDVLQEAVAQ